jgi:hypothetical protein
MNAVDWLLRVHPKGKVATIYSSTAFIKFVALKHPKPDGVRGRGGGRGEGEERGERRERERGEGMRAAGSCEEGGRVHPKGKVATIYSSTAFIKFVALKHPKPDGVRERGEEGEGEGRERREGRGGRGRGRGDEGDESRGSGEEGGRAHPKGKVATIYSSTAFIKFEGTGERGEGEGEEEGDWWTAKVLEGNRGGDERRGERRGERGEGGEGRGERGEGERRETSPTPRTGGWPKFWRETEAITRSPSKKVPRGNFHYP